MNFRSNLKSCFLVEKSSPNLQYPSATQGPERRKFMEAQMQPRFLRLQSRVFLFFFLAPSANLKECSSICIRAEWNS